MHLLTERDIAAAFVWAFALWQLELLLASPLQNAYAHADPQLSRLHGASSPASWAGAGLLCSHEWAVSVKLKCQYNRFVFALWLRPSTKLCLQLGTSGGNSAAETEFIDNASSFPNYFSCYVLPSADYLAQYLFMSSKHLLMSYLRAL